MSAARERAPFAMREPWFTWRARHKAATRDAFARAAGETGLDDQAAGHLADQLALLFDGAIAQAQMPAPAPVARAALQAATVLVDATR